MLVSLVITLVIVATIPPILQTVQGSTTASAGISAGSAQAGLAVENIAVQVGSASQICLPTSLTLTGPTVAPGFAVRVLSLAFNKSEWVQWMVDTSTHVLEQQEWPTTWTAGNPVPSWVVVAHPVVNSVIPPFSLPSSTSGAPRSLAIALYVTEAQRHTSQPVVVKSSVAALNTPYAASSTCATSED